MKKTTSFDLLEYYNYIGADFIQSADPDAVESKRKPKPKKPKPKYRIRPLQPGEMAALGEQCGRARREEAR